jgi:DNA-binding transcriptional ArsR family regulator
MERLFNTKAESLLMQDEKITLDKDVFRTLASETRVGIIKSLDKRRKTLSELSKQFEMSVSTIKEHLDNLVAVGLIVQMDEGHKWKYYELTTKGKGILHPEDKKVWILLGISALGIIVLGFDLLKNSLFGFASFAAAPSTQMLSEKALTEGVSGAGQEAARAASALPQLPYLHIAGFVMLGILAAVSLFYIRSSRKNVRI